MKSSKGFLAIPLYAWAVVLIGLPLLYVVGVSFYARGASWGISDTLTLSNYQKMFDPVYLSVFGRSMLIAGCATTLALLIGYPFAYGMARTHPKRRLLLMILVIVPFWTSALIRTYGFLILLRANGPINSLLQSLGLIDRPLKLLYNDGAVLLGFVYTMLPFVILPCYTAIERLDFHLVEAARDLGGTPWHAFRTVTLPLTRSGIISALTLTFVPSMGLFFLSDLLGGGKTILVGNLIQDQLLRARNTPFGAALAVGLLGLTVVVLWVQNKMGGKT